MKLSTLLKTTPQTLAKEQRDALKAHVIQTLTKLIGQLQRNMYAAAKSMTFDSPSGDGYGRDDTCIDFRFEDDEGPRAFGEVLEKLTELHSVAEGRK